jgi:hypothetical protein
MKNRVKWSMLLVVVALFVAAPVVLAYTSASGQVNDANGNPWTWGGTVVCRTNATNAQVGTGNINPDGSWSVTLGSPAALTCTIDPAAGPEGDPAPFTCAVPGGGGGGVLNYSCGATSTGTGPNAVSLSRFGGQGIAPVWVLVPAVLVAGALAWWRRQA